MAEPFPPHAGWQDSLYDYFLAGPDNQDQRADFIRLGLIPTNNLRLYIVDNPATELLPGTGIANPFDYRQQPFGPIIERLHTEYPDLWEEAKARATASQEATQNYLNLVLSVQDTTSPDAHRLATISDTQSWQHDETYTKVITVIAPWLLEAGIDPLDVCK